jgi:hypothetical protein
MYHSEESIKIRREKEVKFDAEIGVFDQHKQCKIYSNEFIERYIKLFGLTYIQSDYSIHSTKYWPRVITSFYTPFGISKIESHLIDRIINLNEDIDTLSNIILTNPHLHPILRNNLYQNLWRK